MSAGTSLETLVGSSHVLAPRDGERVAELPLAELPAAADRLTQSGARLATLFACDDRASDGTFGLHHVWRLPQERAFVRLVARVDPAVASFPSIAAKHPAANWYEREVMDAFGLEPAGHPNPTPVSVHEDWPDGAFALRKDFEDHPLPRAAGNPHPFRPVTGEGVFHIPVGPVHAGIIEPGHFRFGVAGEPVLYLQLRLFYVHKGTEKRFERLPWRHGLHLAQSVSGDTAVGHALAYAHAVERLAGCEPPPRARYLRVVLLELERVYNHIADTGAIATDVAFSVPAAHAQLLRERLVSLHERLFGSRLLRHTVALGGVRVDLGDAGRQELQAHLRRLDSEFESLVTLLIDSGSFTDRIDGTGILPHATARDIGVVGLAGTRLRHRRGPASRPAARRLRQPPLRGPGRGGRRRAGTADGARAGGQAVSGDRAAGARRVARLAGGRAVRDLPPGVSALGWAEGWRGPCLHWVRTDAAGGLDRVKVVDPSFHNWPGLALAVPGNIVPDFPVINKSFNLSYSGTDR